MVKVQRPVKSNARANNQTDKSEYQIGLRSRIINEHFSEDIPRFISLCAQVAAMGTSDTENETAIIGANNSEVQEI